MSTFLKFIWSIKLLFRLFHTFTPWALYFKFCHVSLGITCHKSNPLPSSGNPTTILCQCSIPRPLIAFCGHSSKPTVRICDTYWWLHAGPLKQWRKTGSQFCWPKESWVAYYARSRMHGRGKTNMAANLRKIVHRNTSANLAFIRRCFQHVKRGNRNYSCRSIARTNTGVIPALKRPRDMGFSPQTLFVPGGGKLT